VNNEKNIFRDNLISIICGIFFLLTGWIWTYGMNLFTAYPFGIAGLIFWLKGRTPERKNSLNNTALTLLILGAAVSLSSLFFYR
jgi:hypothetical protein